MDVDPNWFGPRLRELREQAGLKRQTLAERAGLTSDGVMKLEKGERKPSWETVVAVCRVLGVSSDEFMKPPQVQDKPGPERPAQAKAEAKETKPKKRPHDTAKKRI